MTRLVLHSLQNGRRRQRTLPPPREWPSRRGDWAMVGVLAVVVGCMVFAVVMAAMVGMGT